MKVSDSVVVKTGTLDPDFGVDIGGWQGRVVETGSGDTICIKWDSLTLRQMPEAIIAQSEEQGFDWRRIWLGTEDVEVTTPRDTPRDVAEAQRELEARTGWLHLGEQGRRIQKVLKGIDEEDDIAAFSAWERYLKQRLVFPFNATVFEHWMWGPVSVGDHVKVQSFAGIEDPYGVLVRVTLEGRAYRFPLCDLEVTDKSSPNDQPVDDYAIWFANR